MVKFLTGAAYNNSPEPWIVELLDVLADNEYEVTYEEHAEVPSRLIFTKTSENTSQVKVIFHNKISTLTRFFIIENGQYKFIPTDSPLGNKIKDVIDNMHFNRACNDLIARLRELSPNLNTAAGRVAFRLAAKDYFVEIQ